VEITNIVDKLPLLEKDGVHFGFGFDIPEAEIRMDIPWGIIKVDDDQLEVANRNWLTMQRWIDISNEKEGITWCSPDAPLVEFGGMTANQTGAWNGERKPWLSNLEPGSTVYSWVMNNHWFTNFPLTQDGPVAFRYRMLPHGGFDAAQANRFGLEQSQPLLHVAANDNAIPKPLMTLDGSPAITVSIISPAEKAGQVIIRLRSVSEMDETVRLSWPSGRPRMLSLQGAEGMTGLLADDPLTVPANGLVSLIAEW
jgi:hypothetical protein